MSRIARLSFRTVVRPMRTTFATSLGTKKAATSVLVTVTLADGHQGIGEVPTSFVLPHETPPAIRAILAEARPLLLGRPIREYPLALEALRRRYRDFHMTLAGLEVALFRAGLAAEGKDELQHWGGRRREIETDITIPFVPDTAAAAWVARVTPLGFRAYKVKVSGDVEADIRFVSAVRRMLEEATDRFVIRLDGNQGYTARSYGRMIRRLEKAGVAIELFEQPLRKDDHAGLRRIRGLGPAPVILDETVFCADDCRRVIDGRLAGGVNIKIAKSGIAGSAAILKIARAAGLKLMIGCMTETMVGLSAGICMAAGTGAFDYVDLDSIHFLHHRGGGTIAVRGARYVMED